MTARGSIAAPTKRLLTRSIATTWAAERNAARTAEAYVASGAGMQLRRALSLRRARVGDGGERRVVDLEALGRIDGLHKGCGDDSRDRLANVAHRFAREREARRLGHGRAIARTPHPPRPHW